MLSPILIPTMVCARCNTPCTVVSPGFSLCELCSHILQLKSKAKEEKRLKRKLNGWIDASKQTPTLIEGEDYSENVLAVCNGELCVMCYVRILGDYGGFAWASCDNQIDGDAEFDDDYKVTYWQHLPKLPNI